MEANDITLQALINAPNQYIIPVFQRYYSWQEDDWDALWSDIVAIAQPGYEKRTHFMGSLVFFPIPGAVSKNPRYQVIDGQQRLITFSLMLSALRYLALQYNEESIAAEIRENFLVHRFKKDEEHFRIYPRQRDREEYLEAIINPNLDIEGRIGEAFRFFIAEFEEFSKSSPEEKIQNLFDLLKARLEFVYIQLGSENPYEIFKSLNSKGVPLSEADLIRNFVFMHVSPETQDTFDDKFWRPLESHFEYDSGEQKGELNADLATRFFRDSLMKSGDYVPRNAVFETFEQQIGNAFDPSELAKELQQFAEYYDIIRGRKRHSDPAIDAALAKLRKLETTTTYPLLLALLQKTQNDELTIPQLQKAIELISGFILRRYAASESSRAYGRWFVAACNKLETKPVENLNRFLFEKGFPGDRHFQQAFSAFPWYVRSYTKVVLEALERASKHKEPADLSSASIEHIMPQTLTEEWRSELGKNADEVHDELLHTIGNLTLSAYNPELFNHPFGIKRKDYAKSNITLNRDLSVYETWGESEIKDRGSKLAKSASKIWTGPDKVPAKLKKKKVPATERTNENGLTQTGRLQIDFWTAYKEFLKAQGSKLNPRKPRPDHWYDFAIGRWEFWLGNSIVITENRTDVYLGLQGPDAKRHFKYLYKDKEIIEEEIGISLNWYELPDKKSSYISLNSFDFDPQNRESWPKQHAWMHHWLEAFYSCFRPRTQDMRNLW